MKKQLKKKKNEITLLGTGKPLREFIHADDLASAIIFSLNLKKKKIKTFFRSSMPILNIGTKEIVSIKKLSKLIAKFTGFKGKINFDKQSPDGTFKKDLDISKVTKLGWSSKIKLLDGLKKVIEKRKR